MLLDEQGLPVSGPALFVTVRMRNAGLAFNSIRSKLYDLKVLLQWQENQGRDLEAEFRAGKLLSLVDVVSIRDFAAFKVDQGGPNNSSSAKVVKFTEARLAPVKDRATVSKQVHYNRLTTMADYLEFLGQTVAAQRSDSAFSAKVDKMARSLRQHRPRGLASVQDDDLERLSPPPEVIEAFVRVGSEGHPENPFRAGSIQRRNELIIRILVETGIRRGELLSLRLDNIQTGEEPYIEVRRTQDDALDSRPYQPVAKTKERILPISDQLARKIHQYCMEDRGATLGANRHPYLFVTHRKGATCGAPLSMSTLGTKVFGAMQRVRPEFAKVHPHAIRHHMNYVLSQLLDGHNRRAYSGAKTEIEPISESRELDVRAYLNGHRSLKSSEVYNRRHVREVSHRAVRAVQSKMMKRVSQAKVEDDR